MHRKSGWNTHRNKEVGTKNKTKNKMADLNPRRSIITLSVIILL